MYNAGKYVYGEILPIKYIYGTLDNDKKEKVIFKSYLQINCDLVGALVTVTNGLRTYRGSIDSSGYCIIEIEKSGNYFIIGKYGEYESIPTKMAIVENKHLYEFDLEIDIPDPEPDMDYLTFTSDSGFTLATANSIINWDGTLEYSFDKITWSVWDGTEISSSTGNVIYLRGSNNTFITGSSSDAKRWVLTGENISCSGNIETILDYKTVLNEEHPVMGSNCYNKLFKDCTALITPPELPAVTLANYCYSNMFFGCTSLTSAPTLSADTLARNCYAYMFHGCTSLTEAPELPATTIANFCYNYMFYGCESLTTAPELPATTVAARCYDSMFRNCTSLTTAPELPATVLSNYCYSSMFSGCTSLTVAPELPATTLAESCYEFMFHNCTSLIEISELPATTLANSCYRYMFNGCTSLTTLPELPATELATNCYNFMFYGCTSIKLSSTRTLEYTTPYRIPSEGEGTTATGALSSMFVATGGTFTSTPQINTTYYLWNPITYLTFSSNDPFILGVRNKVWDGTLEYSIDKSNWTTWDGLTAISSNNSNELYLRGTGNTKFYDRTGNKAANFVITSTSGVNCIGNIEFLLDYQTVLDGQHPTMGDYCYRQLFASCTSLVTTPNFPATTLSRSCYEGIFTDCTALTIPPALPATTLAMYCYSGMFSGCTSLTTAPELPATILGSSCYYQMFKFCSALVAAPSLPATTLASGCYQGMFRGCTSLTTVPELSATTLKSSCYREMFYGCTSLTTAPELPATTIIDLCYQSMFHGCTSLATLPNLPATELKIYCYDDMFGGCTSIKASATQTSQYTMPYRIPSEGTGVIATDALRGMFTNTGGTFTGTPEINTTYYLWNPITYLTFSSDDSFTLGVSNGLHNDGTLEYSTDAVTWNTWNGSTLSSNLNNELYIRGTGNTKLATSNQQHTTFVLTANSEVECNGNIENILDYQIVSNGQHPQMGTLCFCYLFDGCTPLISAPELPATTLADGCYTFMFRGCTSLTTPPELPATTLAANCYSSMFWNCTALTVAPELPATTLADMCYTAMFRGCTSLTEAPELPALTVLPACYENMFEYCTSLTTAPELPATTLSTSCYKSMFYGCTSLTTAPSVLPATTLGLRYYEGMFEGCTSLTTAPNILATTLGSYCCTDMFKNCTSLVTAPSVLPALTLTISCYEYMFRGCSSLTTPPSLPATTAAVACYAGMFEGCTSLTSAPALPATTLRLKERCYAAMFANCTSLVTAPELPATEISGSCYFYMFGNCTSLLVPPQLPATTLFSNCYEEMFNGCTSIKLSATQTAEYNLPYCIPTEGTGSVTTNSLKNMFTSTGGTFTGTPTINTTYYLWNPIPDFSAQPIVRTGYTGTYAITWTSTNGTPLYAYYQEMPTSEGSTTVLQTYRAAVSLYNMYAFLGSSWICYVSEDNNGGNSFNKFEAVTIGGGIGGPNNYLDSYDSKNRLYYHVGGISSSYEPPQNADFIYAPKFETVQEGLDGLRRYLDSISG